jgi:hypothetical protein
LASVPPLGDTLKEVRRHNRKRNGPQNDGKEAVKGADHVSLNDVLHWR